MTNQRNRAFLVTLKDYPLMLSKLVKTENFEYPVAIVSVEKDLAFSQKLVILASNNRDCFVLKQF